MNRQQRDLFDAVLRERHCKRCRRKLHKNPRGHYRTRLAGLCCFCLRSFERFRGWSVDAFIQSKLESDN
jgi:hypothetical protein